jgi:uncharacterized BrkB/YihY/UPF0761 family membrane protein
MASEPATPEAEAPAEPAAEPPRKRTVRERTAELRTRAEDARRSLTQQADALRTKSPTARMAFNAYEQDRRHAGALLAGGLAYRLFVWLLPTALVFASLIRLLSDVTSRSAEALVSQVGLGASLTKSVAEAAQQSGRGAVVLLLLGLWLMIWAGMSVVKALRLLSMVAWQVRPAAFRGAIKASLIFSGAMIGLLLSPLALRPLLSGPFFIDVVVWFVAALAVSPAFAIAFAWLPHPDAIPWTAFLPGAVLLAFGLEVLRVATVVYFSDRLSRVEDLYGAVGLATVFMVWLFLMGRLVVAGLTVNAARWNQRTAEADRWPSPAVATNEVPQDPDPT